LRANKLPEGAEFDSLRDIAPRQPVEDLNALTVLLKGKIGFIFTDEPIFELKPRVEANKVSAPAKVGVFAPINVIIPPGPTGMDPS